MNRARRKAWDAILNDAMTRYSVAADGSVEEQAARALINAIDELLRVESEDPETVLSDNPALLRCLCPNNSGVLQESEENRAGFFSVECMWCGTIVDGTTREDARVKWNAWVRERRERQAADRVGEAHA